MGRNVRLSNLLISSCLQSTVLYSWSKKNSFLEEIWICNNSAMVNVCLWQDNIKNYPFTVKCSNGNNIKQHTLRLTETSKCSNWVRTATSHFITVFYCNLAYVLKVWRLWFCFVHFDGCDFVLYTYTVFQKTRKLYFRQACTNLDNKQYQHTFENDTQLSFYCHFCLLYLFLKSCGGNDAFWRHSMLVK